MKKTAIAAPKTTIQNEYWSFLCNLAGLNYDDASYFLLAQQMHKKKFYSIFGNDDNRGIDGKDLRRRFQEESTFIDYSCLDGECSFFEFMLGICVRMAFIEEETEDLRAVPKYFHELLNNCGLDEATDYNYYTSEFNYEYALVVMDRILERRYGPDGRGGFFPLNGVNIPDQRNVEIWYQMCQYIEEREGSK